MTRAHDRIGRPRRDREGGYVLLVVTVFAFVMLIGTAAVVSTTTSEVKVARHQHNSEEAFYLADSAIERARARLVQNRVWRDGWVDEPLANGTYNLSIVDTTVAGVTNDVVRMTATGVVDDATRRIETIAEIPPSGLGLAVLCCGDFLALGRVCVNGRAHVNGWAWFGFRNRNFRCGTLSDGFDVTPPPMLTEPDAYPDDTYYYVRGTRIGGVPQARIYNRHGTDITSALGDSLVGQTSYNNWTRTFSFYFNGNAVMNRYFDETTGVFSRDAGDVSVVVNFGLPPVVNPPGDRGLTDVYLRPNNPRSINATIINSRFEGVTADQLTDSRYWRGGYTYIENLRMQPRNGVAMIAHQFYAGRRSRLGMNRYPGVTYLTGPWNYNISLSGSDRFRATGSFIMLGTYIQVGPVNFTYDDGFLERLPDSILQQWPGLVSGTMRFLSWNEGYGN